MDDAELDRALEAALSVSPSPEFAAKVRTAIGREPAGGALSRWLMPAGAVASLALVAMGLMTFDAERAMLDDTARQRHAGVDILLPSTPLAIDVAFDPVPQPATSEPTEPAIVRNIDRPSRETAPKFEVIFSPADTAAYRRLFENADSVPYTLSNEPALDPTNRAVTAIDIAPIVIPPLDEASDHTGVFQ